LQKYGILIVMMSANSPHNELSTPAVEGIEPPTATYATRASLLLRLNLSGTADRELAWCEFRERYAPVIAGFARNVGVRTQEIDDVIQDVMLGFYAHSPTFVYDPRKGRFRGYLKVCTIRAARRRLGQDAKFKTVPLDRLDDDPAADEVWNRLWAAELLNRAVATVRKSYGDNNTFQAFERYVIHAQPADAVAEALGMTVNGVYKAKERISTAIREYLSMLERDEG
jgi:RNA polymerase sigma factor (sigma-70 family)